MDQESMKTEETYITITNLFIYISSQVKKINN